MLSAGPRLPRGEERCLHPGTKESVANSAKQSDLNAGYVGSHNQLEVIVDKLELLLANKLWKLAE